MHLKQIHVGRPDAGHGHKPYARLIENRLQEKRIAAIVHGQLNPWRWRGPDAHRLLSEFLGDGLGARITTGGAIRKWATNLASSPGRRSCLALLKAWLVSAIWNIAYGLFTPFGAS